MCAAVKGALQGRQKKEDGVLVARGSQAEMFFASKGKRGEKKKKSH